MSIVTITTPFIDRASTLPWYLLGIQSLEYPKDKLHLRFLLTGESKDSTEDDLVKWGVSHRKEYASLIMVKYDFENEMSENHYFEKMSKIRNSLLHMVPDDSTHVFMLDSDVIPHEKSIGTLLSKDVDIIGIRHRLRWMPICRTDKLACGSPTPVPTKGTISVDWVCSAFLMTKQVAENVRYRWVGAMGEDVQFCYDARELGFQVSLNCDIRAIHLREFDGKLRFFVDRTYQDDLIDYVRQNFQDGMDADGIQRKLDNIPSQQPRIHDIKYPDLVIQEGGEISYG